jgi:hypothetical protein
MTSAAAALTTPERSREGDTAVGTATRRHLRLVVRPAPRREPPFDDELDASSPVTAYDRRLPFPEASSPAPPPVLPRPDALPQPAPWGRRLLIGLIESADGRRPLQQLSSMLSFSVVRGLAADFERAAARGDRHWLHGAAIASVRSFEPADGVAELSATVSTGRRVRAVALRVEQRDGRWRCTRLQLG